MRKRTGRPTKSILSLDLATTTGYAYRGKSRRITSGTIDLSPKKGEKGGVRYIKLQDWLDEWLEKGIDLIVYEEPFVRRRAPTQVLMGLLGKIHEFCARNDINYIGVSPRKIKAFATGKGNASKEEMLEACKKFSKRKITSYDEADAFLLLKYIENGGEPNEKPRKRKRKK